MSELGTSIMYKGRKYLDGSIDGSKFATGMEGSIDDTTRVLTLQLKNEETDLGEAVTVTIPSQQLISTAYATDINLTLNTTTGVLSVQLINEDGDPLGTSKEVTLDLGGVSNAIVGASYTSATKTLSFTQDSGEPINIVLSNLQELIDANNKLSSSLVDDSSSNSKFIWQGTTAQYELEKNNIPVGTIIAITDSSNAHYQLAWIGTTSEYASAASTIPNGTPIITTDDNTRPCYFDSTTGELYVNGVKILAVIDQDTYDALINRENIWYATYPTVP